MLRNSVDRWGLPSKLLHWCIAVIVIGMLAFGIYIDRFVKDVYEAFDLIQMHKSWGFVIFCLVAVRITWRFAAGVPELPESVPSWQVLASRASHFLLYALMIVMPVSGWLYASASESQELFGIRNMVFGLFELPDPFTPGSKDLADRFRSVHGAASKLLILLAVVHIAAALKHHFVDRDSVLRRMWF